MPNGTISDREFEKFVDSTTLFKSGSALIAVGGTGYKLGDTVTLSGGTSTSAATFQVMKVTTGGVVSSVIPNAKGAYSVIPTNPVSTTGGSGSGLTLTVTFAAQEAVAVTNPDGTNLFDGDAITISASSASNTTGGTSTYDATGGTGNALLTNTVVQVGTAAAHNLYSWNFTNTGASVAYVQVFDSVAASVTLGTTPPKMSLWVPAGGAWEEKFTDEAKISFTNGIAIAATTTTTGSTSPSTGILANLAYK